MTDPEFLEADVVLFLRIIGVEFDAAAPRVMKQMPRLIEGGLDRAGFAAWLRVGRRP